MAKNPETVKKSPLWQKRLPRRGQSLTRRRLPTLSFAQIFWSSENRFSIPISQLLVLQSVQEFVKRDLYRLHIKCTDYQSRICLAHAEDIRYPSILLVGILTKRNTAVKCKMALNANYVIKSHVIIDKNSYLWHNNAGIAKYRT